MESRIAHIEKLKYGIFKHLAVLHLKFVQIYVFFSPNALLHFLVRPRHALPPRGLFKFQIKSNIPD